MARRDASAPGTTHRWCGASCALLITAAVLVGCPHRGEGLQGPSMATLLARADRAWRQRGEGGFTPVADALGQARQLDPREPEVLWRLVRLHAAKGLADGDRRGALASFASARAIGLECLEEDPAFAQRRIELGWEEALGGLDPRHGACLAWTGFAWTRWMELHGAEAAALDLAVVDRIVARSVELSRPVAVVDWTRGVLAAVRPAMEGRDLDAARIHLEAAIQADPDALYPRADLVLLVAIPTEDEVVLDEQLGQAGWQAPITPEDRRAAARVEQLMKE